MLRRAKNVKSASEKDRDLVLGDAERLENFCVWLVFSGIALEGVMAIGSLFSHLSGGIMGISNAAADAAIAIGVYGEMRFGHVVGNILKIRLSEATERAATAERETEKMKEYAAWRRLTRAQHVRLKAALHRGELRASVQFTVLANDAESLYFAQQISIPFMAAGWKVGYCFELYNTGIFTGILLPEYNDSWLDEIRVVNGCVRDAFIAADIRFVNGWPLGRYMTTPSAYLATPIAHVYVGPKPMPPI